MSTHKIELDDETIAAVALAFRHHINMCEREYLRALPSSAPKWEDRCKEVRNAEKAFCAAVLAAKGRPVKDGPECSTQALVNALRAMLVGTDREAPEASPGHTEAYLRTVAIPRARAAIFQAVGNGGGGVK